MTERSVIDLGWQQRPGLIAAWKFGDDILVDCGPHSSLERLLGECGSWRPRALLLTHIHFDHAGAAGDLVAAWPDLEVWVHRRGARHLANPERLEASARRVFGDQFDRRFGPMRAIPEQNIRPLDGGETVHGLLVEATPGHAQHHLAYFSGDGSAFTGDVTGVRLGPGGPVVLPTPPPDIDLDEWTTSLELIAARRPDRLLLPHFGEVDEVDEHLDRSRNAVARQRQIAGLEREAYVSEMREELAATVAAERQEDYELVVPLEQNHVGLQRWIEGAGAPRGLDR